MNVLCWAWTRPCSGGLKKGNMIKLVMVILASAVAAQAQVSPEMGALRQELREKGSNIGAMIGSLAMNSEKDDKAALQKKLSVIKGLQKNFTEESQLRLELFQELQKLQMGMRYIADGSTSDEKAIKQKIEVLSQIEASLEKSIDRKEYQAMKERSESGRIKGNLSALRSAIQVYYGDMEGKFPDDLSALTEKSKYISAIPFIKPPGHAKASNAVKLVSRVKNMEDLAAKVDDSGGWLYVSDKASPLHGTIVINCNHKDVGERKSFMYSY